MRLTGIHIKSFRAIRDVTIDSVENALILVGQNNTGKSTIIDALRVAFGDIAITKKDFNCLFCFCPLYLVKDCGGAFTYTERGVKDCSCCLFPHKKENYGKIMERLKEEMEKK